MDPDAIVSAAQVDLYFRKAGQSVENVFHVGASQPFNQTQADEIHAVVDTWVKNTLRGQQSSDVTYYGMKISDINDVAGAFEYAGDGNAGTVPGSPLANHVTFALKKTTALAGRKFRGRFYHIGLSTQMLLGSDANQLTAPAVVGLVTTYAALMTALSTAGHPLQVVQWDHTVRPPVPVTSVPVVQIVARDSIIDSQRRRLPGRGK